MSNVQLGILIVGLILINIFGLVLFILYTKYLDIRLDRLERYLKLDK